MSLNRTLDSQASIREMAGLLSTFPGHSDEHPETCIPIAEAIYDSFLLPLKTREQALREALEMIVALSAGWDSDGSTGPRVPLSWESVGRMALDYARAALTGARGEK